jgi:hypothetical protein
VAVAQKGEQADPRLPAPAALRPVLGFSRLSAAAYGIITRVIDEDGIFRARVAEAADETDVGRASWLWLHRPVGWLDDPALSGAPSAGAAGGDDRTGASGARREDKAATARFRKAAAEADAARRRTAEQLVEVRRTAAEVRADRDRLAAAVAGLQDERNAAVRRSKEVEAQLAAARRDLKLARQATMDAEVELARLRAADPPPASGAAERASLTAPPPVEPASEAFDRAEVAASVAAASSAATSLAAALADAARTLATTAVPPSQGESAPTLTKERTSGGKGEKKKRGAKARKGGSRVQPTLPPGVFDGTVEAHRALLADAANLVVVDGYNVARAAWTGLAPEEERRRTVALLDEVQARSGGRVVIVFDGEDAVTAPKASKNVRVRFSATGQTADDAIADLLSATPAGTPVVVVSSDRAVAADARRQGAVAVGSRPFLTAAGR